MATFGVTDNVWIFIGYVIIIILTAYLVNTVLRKVTLRIFTSIQQHRSNLHHGSSTGALIDAKTMIMDETQLRITSRLLSIFVYLIALVVIIYLIPSLRTFSLSLLAGAGVTAVIVGFAIQKPLSNIMAGVFIALYEPFRIGDTITVDGDYGIVEDITLRHTVMRNWEHRRWVIPNSELTDKTIENYSIIDSKFMKVLKFSISYESSIDKAKKIILEEIKKQPEVIVPNSADAQKPEPWVRVSDWLDSGIGLEAGFWVRHINESWGPGYRVMESVKKRFDKSGIEIPYPHRSVVFKKDLTGRKKR